MNDDELRALIRAAVQRHLGAESSSVRLKPDTTLPAAPAISISFGQYQLARDPEDTMCLIEPAVRCNHCGFCKCHGH